MDYNMRPIIFLIPRHHSGHVCTWRLDMFQWYSIVKWTIINDDVISCRLRYGLLIQDIVMNTGKNTRTGDWSKQDTAAGHSQGDYLLKEKQFHRETKTWNQEKFGPWGWRVGWDRCAPDVSVPPRSGNVNIGGSKGGGGGASDAFPRVRFLSFLCSFQEKFGQIIGWRPTLGIGAPPAHTSLRCNFAWK